MIYSGQLYTNIEGLLMYKKQQLFKKLEHNTEQMQSGNESKQQAIFNIRFTQYFLYILDWKDKIRDDLAKMEILIEKNVLLQQHNLRGSRFSAKRLWDEWKENKEQLLNQEQSSKRQGSKKKIKDNSLNQPKQYVRDYPSSSRKEIKASQEAKPQKLSGKCLTII
ncbi:hypothetical protein ABPG72_014020 [Tetrahymena utriculariae]